jgi:hypothetical protein
MNFDIGDGGVFPGTNTGSRNVVDLQIRQNIRIGNRIHSTAVAAQFAAISDQAIGNGVFEATGNIDPLITGSLD